MLAVWPLDGPRSLFWGVEPVSALFVSVISGKEVYFDSIIQELTWKVSLEKNLSKMKKKTKTEKQTQA